MNKQEYLSQLDKHLRGLSSNEREDIIRDLEEHFYEAEQRGKTDQEIIAGLGSPEKMAETIILEAKLKNIDQADSIGSELKASMGALFAILLLAPFNLIFVLIPLVIATFLVIISWKLAFLACISLPVVGFLSIVGFISAGFHLLPLLGVLMFVIGWIGLVFTFVYSTVFVTYLYFKGIVRLVKWNLQFIKKNYKG